MKNENTVPRPKREITGLLEDWAQGDPEALNRLFPMVLDELRLIARASLAREGPDPTLRPTELISEVCLKLLDQKKLHWENRAQFFAFSSFLMRRILVDHARRRRTVKRSALTVSLNEELTAIDEQGPDVLAVNDALRDLETVDPRQARIVEMRVFGGWTVEQTAEALDIAPVTVKRDWKAARLWMRRQLSRK